MLQIPWVFVSIAYWPRLFVLAFPLFMLVAMPSVLAAQDSFGVGQALGIENVQQMQPDSYGTSNSAETSTATAPYSDANASRVSAKPFDYRTVPQSDVFGAQLFTGAFTKEGAITFNPDYVVTIGDKVHVPFGARSTSMPASPSTRVETSFCPTSGLYGCWACVARISRRWSMPLFARCTKRMYSAMPVSIVLSRSGCS